MKLRIRWPNISTENSRPRLNNFFFLSSLIFIFCASGCATKIQEPAVRSETLPSTQTTSAFETFTEGLAYLREHPSVREDERVQRYLWLDRWIKTLQDKNRMTPEMAREYWDDLNGFIHNDPQISREGLRKILEACQTKLAKNIAHYQLYQLLLKDNAVDDALKELSAIEPDDVSDLYTRAQEVLQINEKTKVASGPVARKIGVLLPLSGELETFGQEVLQSIQIVSQLAQSDGVEFLIEDTGSKQETLLPAWNKLVNDEKVTAVIGPIVSKDSQIIFERAEVSSVPVISLAPKENLEGKGKYTFRSTLTIEDQVKRLASFISSDLKSKRVALLLPDTNYGWDVIDRIKEEFPRNSIEIPQIQIYPENFTDFKEPLRRMARLDFPKLRKDEICQKKNPVPGCVKKAGDLKPILDFDVLLVADSADEIGLLLPTLPYLRMYGVQVLGLAGLGSQRLIDRSADSSEGVIFTDGYLPDANNFQSKFFRERYNALAKKDPSRIAAEGFDVALICSDIMKKNSSITRDTFVDALKNLKNFPGVTGSIYFEDQKLKKQPKLIIVRNGTFKELNAAD